MIFLFKVWVRKWHKSTHWGLDEYVNKLNNTWQIKEFWGEEEVGGGKNSKPPNWPRKTPKREKNPYFFSWKRVVSVSPPFTFLAFLCIRRFLNEGTVVHSFQSVIQAHCGRKGAFPAGMWTPCVLSCWRLSSAAALLSRSLRSCYLD